MSVTQVGTPAALSGTNRTTSSPVTGIWSGTQSRTAGNLLVACVSATGTTSAAATAQNTGTTGWVKLTEAGAGTKALSAIWIKDAAGSDAAPAFTSTISGTATMSCTLFELTGADVAAGQVDTFGTTTGSGSVSAVSVTTSGSVEASGEFAIGIMVHERGTAATRTITATGTGYTLATSDGTVSSTGHVGVVTNSSPTSGATTTGGITVSGTVSSSTDSGVLGVFKPAPAALTITNTCEGTSGTNVSPTNSAGPTQFDAVQGTAGTVTYDSTAAHGSTSVKFDGTVVQYVQWTTSLTGSPWATCYARAYVELDALPAAAIRLINFVTEAGTVTGTVGLTTSGQIRLVNNAGSVVATGTKTITAGSFFRVEFQVTNISAGNGDLQATLYLSQDSTTADDTISATGTAVASGVTQIWYGPSSAAAGVVMRVDDIGASNNAALGPSGGGSTPISDSDASGTTADAGEVTVVVAPAETSGTTADAGEHVAATLSDSDTGHGADAAEKVTPQSADTADAGHGTDSTGTVTATVPSSDTGHGTDAGEKTVVVAPNDTGHGTDAGESIAATLSDSDTSHETDAGEKLVTVPLGETGHGTDAGELVTATVPSSDTGHGTDAAEKVTPQSTDTADHSSVSTETGLVSVNITDSDTSHATDAGEHLDIIDPGDSGHSTDSGSVGATIPSSDTSHATDAGEGLALADTETAHGTDSNGSVAVTLADSDTGHGTDSSGTVTASVSDTETAHGTDSTGLVTATVPSSDTVHGTDNTETRSLSDSDTSHATDAGESRPLADADAGHSLDAGEGIAPAVAEAGHGTDGTETIFLSDSDTGHGLDAGESGTGNTTRTDGDFCQGIDSSFSYLSSSDSSASTDSEGAFKQASSDSGHLADIDLSKWPADADASRSTEAQFYTGTMLLSDSDSSSAADNGPPPPVQVVHISDADAGSGADGHIIDVYTFQPPFRWTGGQYEVRYNGRVIWTGPQPDREAFRLHALFAAGAKHVLGSDSGTARDSETPAWTVSLDVSLALEVHLRASVE